MSLPRLKDPSPAIQLLMWKSSWQGGAWWDLAEVWALLLLLQWAWEKDDRFFSSSADFPPHEHMIFSPCLQALLPWVLASILDAHNLLGSPRRMSRAENFPAVDLWIFNSLEGLLLLLLSLLFRQRTCPKRSSSNACSDQEVSANGFSNFCFSLSYWLLHCLSDDVYWGMFWVVEQDPELHCGYQWAPAGGAKPGEWKQQPLCEPGAGG